MPVRPLIYAEDLTGLKPENKITDELHTLIAGAKRTLAPVYAPIFQNSLVVKDVDDNNRVLDPSEYSCIEIQSLLSAKTGTLVFNIILITNTLVSNNISIIYQTVGGEYTRSYASTKILLDKILSDSRPVSYPNITDKPSEFDPVLHLHSVGDLIGFEYVVAALERVRNAILAQNSLATDTILKYIDNKISVINNNYNSLLQDYNDLALNADDYLNHQNNINNPHQTTKAQVGLGNLENYGISTLSELQVPVSNDPKYVTNIVLKEYLDLVVNTNQNLINNSLQILQTDLTNLSLDVNALQILFNTLEVNLQTSIDLKDKYITLLGIANDINNNLLTSQTRTQNLLTQYF